MYLSILFLRECFGESCKTNTAKVRHALQACENEISGREGVNYSDAYDPDKPLCRELVDLYECCHSFDVPFPQMLGELMDTALMETGRTCFPIYSF